MSNEKKLGVKPIANDICINCGASEVLHHFETRQCPKNGIEGWREGCKQKWESTVFEDGGHRALEIDAFTTYNACGLLPSELLAQRDNLLNFIKELKTLSADCEVVEGKYLIDKWHLDREIESLINSLTKNTDK